jgi:hypothetical protein
MVEKIMTTLRLMQSVKRAKIHRFTFDDLHRSDALLVLTLLHGRRRHRRGMATGGSNLDTPLNCFRDDFTVRPIVYSCK